MCLLYQTVNGYLNLPTAPIVPGNLCRSLRNTNTLALERPITLTRMNTYQFPYKTAFFPRPTPFSVVQRMRKDSILDPGDTICSWMQSAVTLVWYTLQHVWRQGKTELVSTGELNHKVVKYPENWNPCMWLLMCHRTRSVLQEYFTVLEFSGEIKAVVLGWYIIQQENGITMEQEYYMARNALMTRCLSICCAGSS